MCIVKKETLLLLSLLLLLILLFPNTDSLYLGCSADTTDVTSQNLAVKHWEPTLQDQPLVLLLPHLRA